MSCEGSLGLVSCEGSLGLVSGEGSLGLVSCEGSLGLVSCEGFLGLVRCEGSLGLVSWVPWVPWVPWVCFGLDRRAGQDIDLSPPPVSPLLSLASSPLQDGISVRPCVTRGRRSVRDGMKEAIKCCLELRQGWDRLDVTWNSVVQGRGH